MIWKRMILSWMTLLAIAFAPAAATAAPDVSPKTHVGAIDLAAAICIEASGLASAEQHRGNWDAVTKETSDVPHAAKGAAAGQRTVIGKLKDLTNLGPGENTLLKHLPDQGGVRANWAQNSGVLRQEMGKGLPMRDASVNPATGDLIRSPGSFLEAERNLLQSHGWSYNPGTTLWSPP